jgi:hypothetical protein
VVEEGEEKLDRRPLALTELARAAIVAAAVTTLLAAEVVTYRCGLAAGTAVVIGYAGTCAGADTGVVG